MGLGFNNNNAHWSYSGFMRFREKLAKAMDIPDLQKMTGFGGATQWSKKQKADPIYLLIYHSDCEGELSVEDCKKIAPRLREIVNEWPEGDDDKPRALELANGMDYSVKHGEPLEFW